MDTDWNLDYENIIIAVDAPQKPFAAPHNLQLIQWLAPASAEAVKPLRPAAATAAGG
jgi:hypothetical protein